MLRDPKSIPASDLLIEDECLEPYFITQSPANGYTVYERVQKEGNKHDYIRTVCYPSTFNNCLKKILEQLLLKSKIRHYTKVSDYLQEYKRLAEKIKNLSEVTI